MFKKIVTFIGVCVGLAGSLYFVMYIGHLIG